MFQPDTAKQLRELEHRVEKLEKLLASKLKPTHEVKDELYEEAKSLVIKHQNANASFLQRELDIGYARTAKILDQLESAGVIGPASRKSPRKIFAQ